MAKRGAEEQLTKDGQNGNGFGSRGDDETSTPVKATAAQLAGRK
jgi:NUP50 (Nucleoporin 50 kDa)